MMALSRNYKILLYGILFSGIFAPLCDASPRLSIESPPKQISLDQSATLRIRLEWPSAEGPYEINPSAPKTENLSLENQNQSQETNETISHTLTYEFRPLKKGTAVIYSFEISYRKSDTDPWTPIVVPEQNIRVVAKSLWEMILTWLALTGGLGLIIFVGLRFLKYHRIREAAKYIPPPDPKQRIYAKAEESIATFTSPDSKEKLTLWLSQLKNIVMAYYDIPPGEKTSAGILAFLRSKGLPAGEWNEVSRLFEHLTELQFSRQDIPSREMDQIQKTLLQYAKGKIIIGDSNS